MTLKEELEILRGEPIQVFTGDPLDIPCIETSDPEKLCKHPVVSVHMITYNHEPYIRQAIEGVMMQKTDFEFELVIGEDCSTDRTREICFEYQKRYPDKIRVLWSHENITVQHPHPAGRNSTRVTIRCRGEFIAFCEGDDYWIDPLKLQKQVDVMRRHPNVGLCFGSARIVRSGKPDLVWGEKCAWAEGVIPGRAFMLQHIFGAKEKGLWPTARFLMTASVLFRREIFEKALSLYEVLHWRILVGDTPLWLGLASFGDVYYLPDVVSVYNQLSTGSCGVYGDNVGRDGFIARMYYFTQVLKMPLTDLPLEWQTKILQRMLWHSCQGKPRDVQRKQIAMLRNDAWFGGLCCAFGNVVRCVSLFGVGSQFNRLMGWYSSYWRGDSFPRWLREEYAEHSFEYKYKPSTVFGRIVMGLGKKLA